MGDLAIEECSSVFWLPWRASCWVESYIGIMLQKTVCGDDYSCVVYKEYYLEKTRGRFELDFVVGGTESRVSVNPSLPFIRLSESGELCIFYAKEKIWEGVMGWVRRGKGGGVEGYVPAHL